MANRSALLSVIDDSSFASEEQLREWTAKLASAGLRSSGAAAHNLVVDWLAEQLDALPDVTVHERVHHIRGWQPLPPATGGGRDLARAGRLFVRGHGRDWRPIPVIGAVPYSRPTGPNGAAGELTYVPAGQPITADIARGKIVLRDLPTHELPLAALLNYHHYLSPDLSTHLSGSYNRAHIGTDTLLAQELITAAHAGAIGMIIAFDIPRDELAGYFDPHRGEHFRIPAVFVGVDERERLRQFAGSTGSAGNSAGNKASVTVLAQADDGDDTPVRTLVATLPGQRAERVMIETHTDGVNWVQENGPAGVLALANFFAAQPNAARRRTIDFALTGGALHSSRTGAESFAAELDAAESNDTADGDGYAYVIGLEQLGARELLPIRRGDGPGRRLEFSGDNELCAFVTQSPVLAAAATKAVRASGLDRVAVLRSLAPPSSNLPPTAWLGGDASAFHQHLIPAIQLTSGPWALWSAGLGERAVDFARMRRQIVIVADIVTATASKTRAQIAGGFAAWRADRAAGAPAFAQPGIPGWRLEDTQ
ncbi:MAG: hypothetical protein J2O49_06490 [Sciscionella sp.]|nr:hypothetical protein [Sciscionella sp.]